jgi:nucleoside-diphosphate-sugar epimerase
VQTAVADLASTIAATVPGAEFHFTPGRAMSDVAQGRFSVAALEGLGWRPDVGLADGIAGYADWLSNHPY